MTDDRDIDAWLETLAGREAAAGAPVGDARALRAALRTRRTIDERTLLDEIDAARFGHTPRLLERARRDPILGPAIARGASRQRGPRGLWSALLAAGIAGVAVLLVWTLRPGSEPAVYRQAPDAVVRLEADDPRALRDEIAAALRTAGVEVVRYERFERQGIDGELPKPVTPAVLAVLARYGIPLPADAVLRVEIAPRASP